MEARSSGTGSGLLRAALFAAVCLFCGTAAARGAEADRLTNELMSGKSPVGGDFALTDHNGRKRSLGDFRGKLVLLYFGYTACPDICPRDLTQIARAVRSLGKARSRDYLIDHTAYTFLLDREGRYVQFFPSGTPAERMAAAVREQLARR